MGMVPEGTALAFGNSQVVDVFGPRGDGTLCDTGCAVH